MKSYLLDTNICIYLLKGLYNLSAKIENAGIKNCYISEITVAELKYGAENSNNPQENHKKISFLQDTFTILPIYTSLDVMQRRKRA